MTSQRGHSSASQSMHSNLYFRLVSAMRRPLLTISRPGAILHPSVVSLFYLKADVWQIAENDATIDPMLTGNVRLAVTLGPKVPFLTFSRSVFQRVPESDKTLFTALDQQLGIKPE